MTTKNKRFCDYKDCGLPENNMIFLVELLYMFIVFVILIKDIKNVTVLNMVLFVVPSAIDVFYFSHSKKVHLFFKVLFIIAIVAMVFLFAMALSGIITDMGDYYSIADTFPVLGHRVFSKWILLYTTASMIGVPFFMFFARPNKKQAKALALREAAIQGE